MADTPALGAGERKLMEVQVLSPAFQFAFFKQYGIVADGFGIGICQQQTSKDREKLK